MKIRTIQCSSSELQTKNSELFSFKKIFSDLGQRRFRHAIFDETHGKRPALFHQFCTLSVRQSHEGEVVLFFLLGGLAGQRQPQMSTRFLAYAFGQ